MVIPYSCRGFKVFLKVPMIIIISFSENNLLGRIYINFVAGLFMKTGKLQEHGLF